eukprot:GEZU01020812.1.p1 GENE.GEZU01020812.1~~GEZU01020812.1.p1  ORF type:complete len:356 (+),score=89.64 GEZU01020812.1:253-1320(+)
MTRIQDDVENNMSLNVPTPSKQKAVPPQPQPQPVSGSSLPLRDQTNTPTEFYPGPQNTRHLAPPAELTIVSSSQDEEQDTSDAEEQQAISGNNGFDYSEYSDMDVSDDDQGYDEEGDCEDDEMEDDNPVSDYSEEEEGEDEEEEDANETNDNSNNNINATGSRLLFMGISTGTELKYRPEPNYIVTRTCNFNDNHRKMLVDWLIEVAHECRYKQQTLHLAINYLDRFLSSVGSRIMRDKLQLAGSVCMFLATKYEEITPMLIQDIVFLTADTYTREQVLAMEALVLNELRFCLTVVTANDFLELIFSQFNPQPAVMALAMVSPIFLLSTTHSLSLSTIRSPTHTFNEPINRCWPI